MAKQRNLYTERRFEKTTFSDNQEGDSYHLFKVNLFNRIFYSTKSYSGDPEKEGVCLMYEGRPHKISLIFAVFQLNLFLSAGSQPWIGNAVCG